jgi:hypothetical protein
VLFVVLMAASVAAACGGSSPTQGQSPGKPHRSRQPAQPSGGSSGSVPPSGGATGGTALPLGTFSATAAGGRCPSGEHCQGFQVACPGVRQPASGTLAIGDQTGTPRGLVVFFSGGKGTGFLGTEDPSAMAGFLSGLHQSGLKTVRVAWQSPWLFSSPGEQIGPTLLGCRPATAVKWVHDNLYAPLGVHPSVGACGFCVAGDSGGSSEAAFPLVDYGLEGIINAAVLIAGPVHTGLAPGCLHQGSSASGLWYTGFSAPIIDGSYGFFSGGPCQSHDPAYTSKWQADSMDTGGRDFAYPTTRVVFIFGANDSSAGPPHGRLLLAKLQFAKTPMASAETVTGMGHLVANSASGLSALRAALLAG